MPRCSFKAAKYALCRQSKLIPYQMSLHSSTESRRSSSGGNFSDRSANASEADTSVLAPEYRGDHVDVEVSKVYNQQRVTNPWQVPPGGGIQTFYRNCPPDAIAIKSPSNVVGPLADGLPQSHRLRRIIIALGIVMTLLIAATLGLGLGLGLKQRSKDKVDATATSQEEPTAVQTSRYLPVFSAKLVEADFLYSATPISTDVSPSPTSELLQSGIRENSSIAALSLSNGDRQLFFQEKSGAIRQAIYSFKDKKWSADANFKLELDLLPGTTRL